MSSSRPIDADATVANGASDAAPTSGAPQPGARLGRYLLIEELGRGGMGVVLRAYDPKLEREVALKLVHTDVVGTSAQARLIREARAMARLAHPNVVAVFDVELALAHDEGVVIVMEYVPGPTLRQWLMERSRSCTEVIATFIAAGRGLAAAHAEGMLHRDFKLDNVLMGSDGRARVTDFGLARPTASHGPAADLDTSSPHADSPHDERSEDTAALELTAAGIVIGTPRSMAPEQMQGGPLDARTDQYAFCVALWYALCGAWPFDGGWREMLDAKRSGPPSWPREIVVPARVTAAIRRGLCADPAERWPTLPALLLELERSQPRPRVPRLLLGAAALALVGGALAGARELDVRGRIAACERAGASITEVWNDDARAILHEALLATRVSFADVTARKVAPWLDQQALAWQHARTETCLDADVRDVWSADTVDRSLWCLDERKMELEALVGELSRADAGVVQKAVSAAAGLSDVGACRDASLLARLPQPPAEHGEKIREMRAELAHASALERAGKYAEGLVVVRRVIEPSETLGWSSLVAAVRALEANLLAKTGAYAEAETVGARAYFTATRTGAWDVAANAATNLVYIAGYRLAKHDDGERWAEHAEVAIEYAGDPEGLREARRLDTLASVEQAAGDYAQARMLKERALAIYEAALGPDHPAVATSLNNLANLLTATGDSTQARALGERALAIREQALGADHPDVALSLSSLGALRFAAGDYAAARPLLERALAIQSRSLGPDHPDVATSLFNLAALHHAVGEYEQARVLTEDALAIFEKALGPDHPDVAACLNNLSGSYYATGDLEKARSLMERALAIRERALVPDHPDVLASLTNLGDVLASSGDYAQARVLLERALVARERTLGHDHPDLADTRVSLANVALAQHRPADALRLAEPALSVFEQSAPSVLALGRSRFVLARALSEGGGDRPRALALARAARDAYAEAGPIGATGLADVQAWLADNDDEAAP